MAWNEKVYGFEMALVAEVYLSTLSAIMEPHGMKRYFLPLLHVHEQSERITQRDLGELLKRDKVSITRIVDALSSQGLIERIQDRNDRRCQLLRITPKGTALIPHIKAGMQRTNELLFSDFSEEEQRLFDNSMDRLMQRLDTLPEPDFIVQAHERNDHDR